MTKNTIFRYIQDNFESAKTNMSIDKALAMSFKKEDMPILRFYTWQEGFTVGASQELKSYVQYLSIYNNASKRMTGGGVLFHGHDISYSLVLSSAMFEGLSVKQSYEKICTFLLQFYKDLGLNPTYAKETQGISLSKSDLCQVGYEAYDIIINGLKIGGNAQKRTKNMIFQHGSIPLFKTKGSCEFGHSLEDLGIKLSYDEAVEKLKAAFVKTFHAHLEPSSLNEKEHEYLAKLKDKQ
jgi:lipoate-protein ligase A